MAKRIMSTHAFHLEDAFTEFFIEELKSNGKWRKIPNNAGPYASANDAIPVAVAYSRANGVKTRVVGIK